MGRQHAPASLRVDAMIRDWQPIKNIVAEVRIDPQKVTSRANRQGYHRYYITEEERRIIDRHRKSHGTATTQHSTCSPA